MSLIYKITAPAVRIVARRQLEEGMKAPAAYMKKMKTLQKKPLPLERLRGAYDFEEKRVGSTVHYMVHSRKSKSNRVILYLHGGGFCRPLKADDFEFAEARMSGWWTMRFSRMPQGRKLPDLLLMCIWKP